MSLYPLGILIRNNADGRVLRLDAQVENIAISTVVPGGFGTLTFQISERAARQQNWPLESFYACDVIVTDQSGISLFEGILTDVKKHSDTSDAYYECDASGWQILLDQPYRNIVTERSIDWQPAPISYFLNDIKHYIVQPSSGQVDPSDPTKQGIRFDTANGTVVAGTTRGGMIALFPNGSAIDRVIYTFDYDCFHTVAFGAEIYGIDANNAFSSAIAIFAGGTGPFSGFAGNSQVGSGVGGTGLPVRGVYINMVCTGAGTASAACWSRFYNFRFLSKRAISTVLTSLSSEPVYGHEIVADILAQSQMKQNYPFGIETDTSYQVPQFSYQLSDTQRNALDAITAYYNRYWAVWDNKQFYWRSWTPQSTADWIVSRDSGAQVDLDPTVLNAARSSIVQWTDALGVAQETVISDVTPDNAFALAGATRTAIIPLQIQGIASAAAQLGAVYWPDHSYEVVSGTISLPAAARCYSQSYGTLLPAYRIRAGDSVRVRDAPTSANIFNSTSWNRSTLFRITATDLDWENQEMKLTIDNAQSSIDQLLSRVQLNLSSKFGQ